MAGRDITYARGWFMSRPFSFNMTYSEFFMNSDLELEQFFFHCKELFFKNFVFNNRCKNEIHDNTGKYAVDLAIQFPERRRWS